MGNAPSVMNNGNSGVPSVNDDFNGSKFYINTDGKSLLVSEILSPQLQLHIHKFLRFSQNSTKPSTRRFVFYGNARKFKSSRETMDHILRDFKTEREANAGPPLKCPACLESLPIVGSADHFIRCLQFCCSLCCAEVELSQNMDLKMTCKCRRWHPQWFSDERCWVLFRTEASILAHMKSREKTLDMKRRGLDKVELDFRELMECQDSQNRSLNSALNHIIYSSYPLRFQFYQLY